MYQFGNLGAGGSPELGNNAVSGPSGDDRSRRGPAVLDAETIGYFVDTLFEMGFSDSDVQNILAGPQPTTDGPL